MRLKMLSGLAGSILTLILLATPVYAALSSKDIEKELMCQCGCTMVVDVCDCETANQIRTKIAELMNQGQNKDQIVAYFVGQYGEKMRSSPAKKGFNLVAWVVPFAAVVAGSTGLYFILRAWTRKGKTVKVPTDVIPVRRLSEEEAEEYRDRLAEELKRIKEEG